MKQKPYAHGCMRYSKRHNKFLLPVPAKAIYGSFCRTENEIFNVVNYNLLLRDMHLALQSVQDPQDLREERERQ